MTGILTCCHWQNTGYTYRHRLWLGLLGPRLAGLCCNMHCICKGMPSVCTTPQQALMRQHRTQVSSSDHGVVDKARRPLLRGDGCDRRCVYVCI
jgi:hypothetical protein